MCFRHNVRPQAWAQIESLFHTAEHARVSTSQLREAKACLLLLRPHATLSLGRVLGDHQNSKSISEPWDSLDMVAGIYLTYQ